VNVRIDKHHGFNDWELGKRRQEAEARRQEAEVL